MKLPPDLTSVHIFIDCQTSIREATFILSSRDNSILTMTPVTRHSKTLIILLHAAMPLVKPVDECLIPKGLNTFSGEWMFISYV